VPLALSREGTRKWGILPFVGKKRGELAVCARGKAWRKNASPLGQRGGGERVKKKNKSGPIRRAGCWARHGKGEEKGKGLTYTGVKKGRKGIKEKRSRNVNHLCGKGKGGPKFSLLPRGENKNWKKENGRASCLCSYGQGRKKKKKGRFLWLRRGRGKKTFSREGRVGAGFAIPSPAEKKKKRKRGN